MYEKLINNTEELNAMAVHLRNSQNFSELKVLAAQWLVPKQDVEDFIKGKKFQLAEIPLSEKEYTSAVEKLREEMWHMKDQKAERKKRMNALKKEEERRQNAAAYRKASEKGALEGKSEKSAKKGEEKQKPEEVSGAEKQKKAEKSERKSVQMSLFDMMADKNEEKEGEEGHESV